MRNGRVFTRYDFERIMSILGNRDVAAALDAGTVNALKRDLEHSRLVDSTDIRSNIVTMNSKFYLKNLGNGRKDVYSLVFPEDCNDKSKINVFTGMGMQLLGSTIGTVIKPEPSGDRYLVIEEIVYQPEAAGDYHL
jgi:regulator of nucleoside diphosphate kinase